jgi:hypothetical protein
MNQRRFDRDIGQAARIVALVLAVPAVFSAAAGNAPGFAAGLALLMFAVRRPQ